MVVRQAGKARIVRDTTLKDGFEVEVTGPQPSPGCEGFSPHLLALVHNPTYHIGFASERHAGWGREAARGFPSGIRALLESPILPTTPLILSRATCPTLSRRPDGSAYGGPGNRDGTTFDQQARSECGRARARGAGSCGIDPGGCGGAGGAGDRGVREAGAGPDVAERAVAAAVVHRVAHAVRLAVGAQHRRGADVG